MIMGDLDFLFNLHLNIHISPTEKIIQTDFLIHKVITRMLLIKIQSRL